MVRIKGIFTGYIMYKEHIQGMHTRNICRECIQGIFTGYIYRVHNIPGIYTRYTYREYIQGLYTGILRSVYIQGINKYIYIYIYRVYTQEIYKQGT